MILHRFCFFLDCLSFSDFFSGAERQTRQRRKKPPPITAHKAGITLKTRTLISPFFRFLKQIPATAEKNKSEKKQTAIAAIPIASSELFPQIPIRPL